MVECTRKRQAVRPFLAGVAKHQQTRIILLREELERRRVFERVDLVLLEELDGVGRLEGVQVGEGELADLRAFLAAQEERCLWVLDDLGSLLFQSALRAGILGFATIMSLANCVRQCVYMYLAYAACNMVVAGEVVQVMV
jgi:hypothetical protein